MNWQEVLGSIGIFVGAGVAIATVIFVIKDRTRQQTITSQGELIDTLVTDIKTLKRHDAEKQEQIDFLKKEVVKLRGEINGKDLLIVTALKLKSLLKSIEKYWG
jgi:hypothetical protein